ncbi:MAG: signal peptidase I [Gemmatimonadaceae bacterium]
MSIDEHTTPSAGGDEGSNLSDGALPSSRSITPERRTEALRDVNRGPSRLGFLWEWTKILPVSIILFLVIQTFLVQAFKIPSGSMEGTLQVGDFLLVNKLVYGAEVPFTHTRLPRLSQPQDGDVIVFKWPEDLTKDFVKRLVGVPGDTLQMRDGTLIRNGATIREGYVEHTEPDMDPAPEDFRWQRDYLVHSAMAAGYHPSRNNWGPLVVPKGNYFVLGDNRDNSLDSRYWGFVADSLLKGRPFVIYYSYSPDSVDTFAWLSHIRWTRLGGRIH